MQEKPSDGSWRSTENAEQDFYEWLFVNTVRDLDSRTRASSDRYTLLGIAPLLRKLLIDKKALVHAANRVPRLTLEYPFQAAERPGKSASTDSRYVPAYFYGGDALFDGATGLLSHDQLLATPVAYFREDAVSFAETVRHYSHVEGGVHITSPHDERSKTLMMMSGVLLEGESYFTDVLRPMGKSVVEGLRPLVSVLEARSHGRH